MELAKWQQEEFAEIEAEAARPMDDLVTELHALYEGGDEERDHARADHLLCALLLQQAPQKPQLREAVRAWMRVGKWYA